MLILGRGPCPGRRRHSFLACVYEFGADRRSVLPGPSQSPLRLNVMRPPRACVLCVLLRHPSGPLQYNPWTPRWSYSVQSRCDASTMVSRYFACFLQSYTDLWKSSESCCIAHTSAGLKRMTQAVEDESPKDLRMSRAPRSWTI